MFDDMRSVFLALLLVILFAGCEKTRTACIYEIPEGLTGWVLIEYGRTNCPPLIKRDGKFVFQIGADGRLCTSSQPEYGRAKDLYYYVGKSRTEIRATGWGGGRLIWAGSIAGTQGAQTTHETFFVGTEAQFNATENQNKKPNQQGGASGSQPFSPGTNSTSAAAVSRRSP
jgi:uncharacterized protein DUF6843